MYTIKNKNSVTGTVPFPCFLQNYLFFTALILMFFLFSGRALGENIRVNIIDTIEISKERPSGASNQIGYNDSVMILMDRDTRFLRGIEIELTAPQLWLAYNGSLAVSLYALHGRNSAKGHVDLDARQIRMDVMANRIQTVYQIPLRKDSNLRNTPYSAVLPEMLSGEFPVLLRIMPIIKDVAEDVQNMKFHLNVKPIFNSEGSARINIHYPVNLQNKPYTMLIDDIIIENPNEEQLLKEGSHHLILISDFYRNESRRFVIERGKTVELNINMQDLTPIILFEAPNNARIFLDNVRFTNTASPKPVETGPHEIKIQLSDYTIIKSVYIQKGKTYRISFTVDIIVQEEE
ncbi:MAG: PEGA domain-containing protein [Spirochaetaceae bacterium]|jgi:hypothetical protein|nr:PEGA domain-containing protein [Spirochaetaceae bacterium]